MLISVVTYSLCSYIIEILCVSCWWYLGLVVKHVVWAVPAHVLQPVANRRPGSAHAPSNAETVVRKLKIYIFQYCWSLY